MSFDRIGHTIGILHKIKFYCVYGKIFFSLSHFLLVEDYDLSKSTSHLLTVPLTLECVGILPWSIFFLYFSCLPDDVLCKIVILANDTAPNSSCDKPSDLSQQAETAYKLQFDLKNQNCWKLFLLFMGYFLIFRRQGLVFEVIYSSSNIKCCYIHKTGTDCNQ